MKSTLFAASILLLASSALAHCSQHVPEPAHPVLVRRQRTLPASDATSASTSHHRSSHTSTEAAGTTATTSASTTAGTAAVAAAPGAINPYVAGALPLPDWTQINIAEFPELDRIPPTNSAMVQGWIADVRSKQIPNIPVTGIDGCSNTTYNAQALKDAGADGNCWWTCGGCERDTDIVTCPKKDTWGMSFDDGPSEDTPRLLDYLESNGDLKSTFFVVGSRALSRPEILQNTYMAGHEISVHTWSHNSLTTMTNEEIIAELGWSKEVIKAVIGVTPTTMRPPYGDIDDRVRAICLAMDLTPIIWTSVGEQTFDTQDWRLGDPASHVTQADVMENFKTFLDLSQTISTGFIVLAHDLYTTSVNLAIQSVLPGAIAFRPKLTLQPINTCQGKAMSEAYVETATGASADSSSSSSSSSASSSAASSSSSSSSTRSSGTNTADSAAQADASASTTPSSGASQVRIGAGVLMGMAAGLWLL
ncbi:hypothetical protein BCR35DRAFT_306855 [Leucosporidium creatinivorum]|uniref:chitin deacetylase n=1 Tax=Leucosporidium creatinivorum TaxID=106004 RepID=A0A1Y2ES09_9BASI|nr:hypothetical protein BCR35DRAFT_306855 [Leucosporidium creatinivorum]